MSAALQAAFTTTIQMIAAVGEHQIVQDAALVVGEQAIALPPLGQAQHIDRHQGFKRPFQVVLDTAPFSGARSPGPYG
jgi:hypothetical protein